MCFFGMPRLLGKIDNHWKLNGTISNITDKVFITGAYGNIAYYGEGRLMKATMTYSLVIIVVRAASFHTKDAASYVS